SANDIIIPKLYSEGIKYISTVKKKLLEAFETNEEEIDELFNTDNNPFENRKELNIHIIRPKELLESDGLKFIPSQMERMLNKGFERAEEYFRNLPV
ncbi:MAG: hypothetical protein ABI840_11700, partial [bacterium]